MATNGASENLSSVSSILHFDEFDRKVNCTYTKTFKDLSDLFKAAIDKLKEEECLQNYIHEVQNRIHILSEYALTDHDWGVLQGHENKILPQNEKLPQKN